MSPSFGLLINMPVFTTAKTTTLMTMIRQRQIEALNRYCANVWSGLSCAYVHRDLKFYSSQYIIGLSMQLLPVSLMFQKFGRIIGSYYTSSRSVLTLSKLQACLYYMLSHIGPYNYWSAFYITKFVSILIIIIYFTL